MKTIRHLAAFAAALCLLACAQPAQALAGDTSVVTDPVIETSVNVASSLDVGQVSTTKNVEAGSDSSLFSVTLGAEASAAAVTGYSNEPQDVVFVIDVSGSMQEELEGEPRYERMVDALNSAIAELMEDDANNRVGIVAFASSADGGSKVLLPLGHYEPCAWGADAGKYVTTGVSESVSWGGVVFEGDPFIQVCAKGARTYASSVTGGTNLEKGIGLALTMFLEADAGYGDVQRIPSLVIASDGDPTYVLKNTEWWNPVTNSQMGAGTGAYAGNGFISMLAAASAKRQIDAHYGSLGLTRVYTVGCNVDELGSDDASLAEAVLDPSIEASNGSNAFARQISDYWMQLQSTGSVSVNVGSQTAWGSLQDKYVTVTQAPDDLIPSDLEYVDAYYDVSNVSDLNAAFDDISTKITSQPATNALAAGTDLVFEDWTGAFTGVDGLGDDAATGPVLTYGKTSFSASAVSVSGSTYTYTYSGTVDSTLTPGKKVSLSGVSVQVTQGEGETPDHIVWTVPAELVPHTVIWGVVADGTTCESLTSVAASPIELSYGVSPRASVVAQLTEPGATSDASLVRYIEENATDGAVTFYANGFDEGATEGEAYATFTPATTNASYVAQEDLAIWTNESMTARATSIDADATYYVATTYLEAGKTLATAALAVPGSALGAAQSSGDGMYEPAGMLFRYAGAMDKTDNTTGTASEAASESISGNRVVNHLGNNGAATYTLAGSVAVTKTVTAAQGLTPAADAAFPVAIHLDGADTSSVYDYAVLDSAGATTSQGTVADGSYVDLEQGQTLYFYGLTPGATYTVSEGACAGFTSDATATGTVSSGSVERATLENTYSVQAASIDTPTVSKTYLDTNENAAQGDFSSTFTLTGTADAPMPQGSNKNQATATIDGASSATFGTIEITKPGTWAYTIAEANAAASDMVFSAASYTWTVTATDNGDGTLSVASKLVKQTADDGSDALDAVTDAAAFTNTYTPGSTSVVLGAYKDVADASGAWTLADGQFAFTLTPDAANPDGDTVARTLSNQGNYVVAPAITYKAAGTYRYTLAEVAGDAAGMSYDPDPVEFTVTVADVDGKLSASVAWTKDGSAATLPTFTNTYEPAAAAVAAEGTKTMTGRALGKGETCTFTLQAANAETRAAVDAGWLTLPGTATATGDGSDQASFSFAGTATHVGTYTFTLAEAAGSAPGVAYDTHACTVTVDVTDEGGTLVSDVTYANGNAFTNAYAPAAIEAALPNVEKTLAGRDALRDETYAFTATCDTTEGISCATETATAGRLADGVAQTTSFLTPVTYTKPGTYVWMIRETPGDAAGMTYDASVWIYTVTVVDDTGAGKLEIASATLAKDGIASDAKVCSFTNTYKPSGTAEATLACEKEVLGRDFLPTDSFQAVLSAVGATDAQGNVVACPTPATTTVTMTADAPYASFGDVSYTQAGTYVYRIEEVPGEAGKGFSYTCPAYTATVVVTDDHATATLNATVSYATPASYTLVDGTTAADTTTNSCALFVNQYTASGTIEAGELPDGVKVVDGFVQTGGECEFMLAPADDASSKKLGVTKLENGAATASNDTGTSIAAILTEDGTGLDGLFSAVTFTKDDCGKTFAWTLAETGADAGFSIDRTIYRIEAVPTDNGDGTVSVACSVTPEPLTQEEFAQATNTTWAVTPHTMSFRDSYVKPTDTADAAPVDSTQDKNAGTESGSVGSQTGAPAIGSEATPDSPTGSGTDTSSGAGTNDKTADKGSASGKIKAKAGKTGSSKHVKATSSASTSAPETGDSNKAWLQGLIICVAVAAIGAGIALWRKNKR